MWYEHREPQGRSLGLGPPSGVSAVKPKPSSSEIRLAESQIIRKRGRVNDRLKKCEQVVGEIQLAPGSFPLVARSRLCTVKRSVPAVIIARARQQESVSGFQIKRVGAEKPTWCTCPSPAVHGLSASESSDTDFRSAVFSIQSAAEEALSPHTQQHHAL